MATNEAARTAVFNAFKSAHDWANRMDLKDITGEDISGDTQITFHFEDDNKTFSLMAIRDLMKDPKKLCERLTFAGRKLVYIPKDQWAGIFDQIYSIAREITDDVLSDAMTEFLNSGKVARATNLTERDNLLSDLRNVSSLKAFEWGDEIVIHFLALQGWVSSSPTYQQYGSGMPRTYAQSMLKTLGFRQTKDWANKSRIWRCKTDELRAKNVEWTCQDSDGDIS